LSAEKSLSDHVKSL